jgi:xanthine/CO dehydrogenase XdhC/CoxF family maturation factor
MEKLICPIGLSGIESKEPAVVAISVTAQILQMAPARPARLIPPTNPVTRSCGDCVCPPVQMEHR